MLCQSLAVIADDHNHRAFRQLLYESRKSINRFQLNIDKGNFRVVRMLAKSVSECFDDD